MGVDRLVIGFGILGLIVGIIIISLLTNISAYFSVISISFVISFFMFYKMKKEELGKLDIIYIYVINILGFAIGSKLFDIIEIHENFTLFNITNTGYSFVGGMIGSVLCVFLYCKKYKLDYLETQSSFFVIYPLIYSISKIACQINGCCRGINLSDSVVGDIRWLEPLVNCIRWYQPLIEAIIMYILFHWLYRNFNKLKTKSIIGIFLVLFGALRFIIDYFRMARLFREDILYLLLKLTLTQIVCIVFIAIGIVVLEKIIFEDKLEVENKKQ
ncbi:MAG: prolipoprotein diacylglyceryl transferase [Clostridiales bacterium]|nr:prolipoprotein diacylglyceryl transferase [Clostridiales bacterium]